MNQNREKNSMNPQQILKRNLMDNQSSSHYLTLIDNESNLNMNVSSYDIRAPQEGSRV